MTACATSVLGMEMERKMAQGNSIRDEIRAENKKMKDMSFSGKCHYVWAYYRLHIAGVIVAIAAVSAMVITLVLNHYERSFYCILVDGQMEGIAERSDYLTANFTNYLGLDGKKQRVIFDNNYTFVDRPYDYDQYYSVDKIFAMAYGKTLDGYISEYNYALAFCSDEELFLEDLRNWLTPRELEKVSDYLIYYTDRQGVQTPVSIDLSASRIKSGAGLLMERPCYGIVTTSEHKENGAAFIRFLFDL